MAFKFNFIFFKFNEYFRLIYYQILKGSIYGTIPFIFIITIIYFWYGSTFILDILGDKYLLSNWDGKLLITQLEKNNIVYGRLGLFWFFFGLLSTQLSIDELIPYPNKEHKENFTDKLINKQKVKSNKYKYKEILENKKNDLNESVTTEFIEKNEDYNKDLDVQDHIYLDIDKMLIMKSRIYQAVCILFSIFNIYFITICKTELYTNNVLLLTFIFLIIDMVIIWFLNNYILKEMLLIAPILVSFEFVQIIGLHFLKTFNQFVIIYLGRITIVSLFRIFIDPNIQSIQIYKRWIYYKLKLKSELNEKYEKYLKYFKDNEINDEKYFFITGKRLEIKNEVKNELILFSLVSFTTKAQINYNRPMTLLIVFLFPELTVRLNSTDYYKYILFLIVILFVHIGVDILTLYIIELIHKFKIFDYFSYCDYRRKNRIKDKLKDSITLDINLNVSYRSLDAFCFSDQYYFLITYMAFANLMMMFGILMMFTKSYIPYRDPFFLVIFLVVLIINTIVIKLFNFFWTNIINFWKIIKPKDNKKVKNNLDLENYSLKKINMNKMTFIKEAFLIQNKEFIINNIKYILKREDFKANNEHLLKIYKQLIDIEKIDQIKDIKKIINQRKGLNNYKNNALIVPANKKNLYKLIIILNYWKALSKNVIYFKKIVNNIKFKYKKNECKDCKINLNLTVNEILSFNELFKIFRIKHPIKFPNKSFFIKFYEKYQKFETLCQNCKIIKDIKKFKSSKKYTNKLLINDINDIKGKNVYINILLSEISDKMKKLLFFWHITAKSRILHRMSNLNK